MIQIRHTHRTRTARLLLKLGILMALSVPLLVHGTHAQEAGSLIDGANVDGVVNIARQFGSAALSRQSNGDPLIVGSINDYRYTLRFLNCADRPACEDLNFRVGFQSKPSPDVINAWNAGKRFSRAYFDAEGDAILEMDEALIGGISPANLSASFSTWRLSMAQFIEHIGFK